MKLIFSGTKARWCSRLRESSRGPPDDKVSIAIISSKKGCNMNTVSEVFSGELQHVLEPSQFDDPNNKDTGKSVIEHGNHVNLLRWRKRIGHMFHIIRWNKSIKPTTMPSGQQ
ncbi:putative serine/threonine-protein kinase [Senna tora]|uniref:Putative serine/threonine-protein kinase n=1 Tax=Senna tora TaxID=362788 RepID=A0A834W1L3_9FABA|nr:putative serine/threonine-protein kinase [Senna tora]